MSDTNDSIRVAIREKKKDLAGINPKLSTYKKIEAEIKELEARLTKENAAV